MGPIIAVYTGSALLAVAPAESGPGADWVALGGILGGIAVGFLQVYSRGQEQRARLSSIEETAAAAASAAAAAAAEIESLRQRNEQLTDQLGEMVAQHKELLSEVVANFRAIRDDLAAGRLVAAVNSAAIKKVQADATPGPPG